MKKILRQSKFFVVPEFKPPDRRADNPAVADPTAADLEWAWSPLNDNTMHPFWAVRRMTETQLRREVKDTAFGKLTPRFNCELKAQQVSGVLLVSVREELGNLTRFLDVPFLTNKYPLQQGEELILEIPEQRKVDKGVKRQWRDIFQHDKNKKA